jgi:NADH-quinone oxidoreductase subunit J
MTLVFYISAVIAVVATLAAVTRINPVHSLLYFILSLLAIGVIFFVLGAPFVAALIIIINAGAIMVLLVFIIMMVSPGSRSMQQEKEQTPPWVWIAPEFLAVILFIELLYILFHSSQAAAAGSEVIKPVQVGSSLFGSYLLGVELVSMILLVGLIGAHHLARGSHVIKDKIVEE